MNKLGIHIAFVVSLVVVAAYKVLIKEEPWAIGVTQIFALAVILGAFYAAALNSSKVKEAVTKFFTEGDSPVNIAFFRIVFFGYLTIMMTGGQMLWFSQFPKELQFAPMGSGWLLPYLPVNLTVATVMLYVFKGACFLMLIGFFTRFAAPIAALTGFYVYGIQQFYGSVSHNHHLFWFISMFAVSRCADVLSIDAVIKNFKKADRNQSTAMPDASLPYALPLRFMWILMGICYFFPGFWKLWVSGNAWILGDNMRNHMYVDWVGFDFWLPVIRIDQWPLLCKFSGAFAIFFEICFVFFLFSPVLRYAAFGMGLLFHNMTFLLMNIPFHALQICYTSIVNWERVFQWLGKKLFKEEMVVLYDGSCSFCRRAVGFLQVFDVLGRIRYLDQHGDSSKGVRDQIKVSSEQLMVDMHALIDTKVVKGFDAYRNIAARIPLLWIVYPFLFLGFVQVIGNNIYRNVADHRSCRIPTMKEPEVKTHPSYVLVIALGSFFIAANLFMGFIGKGSGWPFACYPTFSEVAWDRLRTIDCNVVFADGTEKTFPLQTLKKYTGAYKIVGIVNKISAIKDEELRKKKFQMLWTVIERSIPELRSVKTVRFYFLENYTDPAKWKLNPVKTTLALEFDVTN